MHFRLSRLFLPIAALLLATSVSAGPLPAVPAANTIPVNVPGTSAFGATTLDLRGLGYVEQEFYVSGLANRYRITNPLGTAAVIDGGWSYNTRMLVRRPIRQEDFNGTVVVEWYNVTLGEDVDFMFSAMYEHLLGAGYAYVALSAQLVGTNTLTKWSPLRYGSINITAPNNDPNGGVVDSRGDVLSWDIFGQVGKAVLSGAGLGGLKPKRVIGLGESQSASRLTSYYNSIHPLHQVYESFVYYDRAGALRTDLGTKAISINSSVAAFPAPAAPDDNDHRWWEIAGASHVSLHDITYLDPIVKSEGVVRDASGNPTSITGAITGCANTPLWSRVHSGQGLNSALEHVIAWSEHGVVPPTATRLLRDANGQPALDAKGRVTGGVRLPAYDAPIADNGGYNSGPGFCILPGFHHDYSEDQLCELYKNHGGYVDAVSEVAHRALRDGFMIKSDVDTTINEAAHFRFSCHDHSHPLVSQ